MSLKSSYQKREKEICKANEEFYYSLRSANWNNPNSDITFRLAALIQFHPAKSTRQIFNHALVSTEGV